MSIVYYTRFNNRHQKHYLPSWVQSHRIRRASVSLCRIQIEARRRVERFQIINIPPAASEYIQRLRKHVIVYQARVNGEYSHQEYDVASPEEYVPYFVVGFVLGEPLLVDDEDGGECRHDDAVANVAEHYREQEWECYYCVQC